MPTETNEQPTNAETPAEEQVYFPGVEAPPKKQAPIDEIPAENQVYPFGAGAEPTFSASVQPFEPQVAEPAPQPAVNMTYVYAAVAVALGVLAAILVAAFLWTGIQKTQQSDWPAVVSSEDGLRGHLVTKWEEKAEYRVTLAANDPAQSAGFAFAVAHAPRPVAFDIQLKDPLGFVLCSKNIVMKFDPRNAPGPGAADAGLQNGKDADDHALGAQAEQSMSIAKLEALELERELGKDVFQNDLGPDGKIQSISSQGEFPCSKKAFEGAASWSFSSNFPTAAEQADLMKPPAEDDASGSGPSGQKTILRKSSKWKPGDAATPFYTEGDDMIVAYDASTGVIETVAGRTSFIDKAGKFANAIKGRDFPIEIHYRCDQTGLCALSGAGATGLQVRLKR